MSKPRHSQRSPLPPVLAVVALGLCPSPSSAQDPAAPKSPALPGAAEVVKKTEEWILTRRLLSEEDAAWRAESATLTELNAIRSQEIAELDEFIDSAGARVEALDQQKSTYAEERNHLRKWRGEFEGDFAKLETEVTALLPRLPLPLRDKIEETVLRIEASEPDRALQDRVRDVLIVLQAAKEFDEGFTVASDVREFAGEKREIDILYLGLSQAWYVDASGAFSGYGLPGAEGWTWSEDRAIATQVRNAIEIQRGRSTAAFVELPFIPTAGKEGAE